MNGKFSKRLPTKNCLSCKGVVGAGGAVNRRYAYDKAGNLIHNADKRSVFLHYVYDKIGRIQEGGKGRSDCKTSTSMKKTGCIITCCVITNPRTG